MVKADGWMDDIHSLVLGPPHTNSSHREAVRRPRRLTPWCRHGAGMVQARVVADGAFVLLFLGLYLYGQGALGASCCY